MNTNDSDVFVEDRIVVHRIKFALFLILLIPSLLTYVLIFVYLNKHRNIARSHHHQATILLCLISFIQTASDVPLPIAFYRYGLVIPTNATFCVVITCYEYSLCGISLYMMAIISIQRHFLIFNSQMMNIRWKKNLILVLPLIFCCVYPPIFYISVIPLDECNYTRAPWDFTMNLCGYSMCYLAFRNASGSYDWLANNAVPTLTIFLANITLIIRVVEKKHRLQQRAVWKRERHMTKQLLKISSLYAIGWTPVTTVAMIQLLWQPDFAAELQRDIFYDLPYFICLLFPYIVLSLLPEIVQSIWIKGQNRSNRRVDTAIQLPKTMTRANPDIET